MISSKIIIADVQALHFIISYYMLNGELDIIDNYLDYVPFDACLKIIP
jgi:hypothetical protein